MKWIKKGRIFKAEGQSIWMNSHTTPISVLVLNDKIRVFFSSRTKMDQNNNYISYPMYVDLNIDNPKEILKICDKPLFSLGTSGAFDEFGIMLYKSIWMNDKLYMYYGGWQRLASPNSPYQVLLGLAISEDEGNSFKKFSDGPIMGTDILDTLSIGNICGIVKNKQLYFYYTSYTRWENKGIKATPEYNIKLAISSDGINFKKENQIILAENEKGGTATPCIFEYKNKYHMLFGYRKPYQNNQVGKYQIGYAESTDLIHWTRNDENSGLTTSDGQSWDSEMICYPSVVKVKNKYLCFYCGNEFGKEGFGYAELQQEKE